MVYGGGMTCIKYMLFIFNFIVTACGIGLIAVGAYTNIKGDDYAAISSDSYSNPGILIIVVGSAIFLVAFCGCCGAIRESTCLLMTFAVFLSVIFIVEVAGAIAAFVLKDKIDNAIKDGLTDSLQQYNDPHKENVKKTWDNLQSELDCCGVLKPSDWKNVTGMTQPPASCCRDNVTKAVCDKRTFTDTNIVYAKGCSPTLRDWLKDKMVIVGGVALGFAVIELIGIVLACCLAQAIKEY